MTTFKLKKKIHSLIMVIQCIDIYPRKILTLVHKNHDQLWSLLMPVKKGLDEPWFMLWNSREQPKCKNGPISKTHFKV